MKYQLKEPESISILVDRMTNYKSAIVSNRERNEKKAKSFEVSQFQEEEDDEDE